MSEKTIASVLAEAQQRLVNSDSARLDVEIFLSDILNCDRAYLYAWPERELSVAQYELFLKKLSRRLQGEPVAYITGKKEFWSLMLEVNASTLVPRPETELLVEVALQTFSEKHQSIITVLDLGTGSGAIALALATERPVWQIRACDVQHEAVQLAQHNARALDVRNASFFVSNWFSEITDSMFDLIVSNPPYIDANDDHLSQGDLRFEPKTALVANKKGFADIEKIIQQAIAHLKPGGWLMLEHGFTQAAGVRTLFSQSDYGAIETFRDMAGKDRVTIAQKLSRVSTHG